MTATAATPGAECVLCERASALDAEDLGWLLRTECWGVSMHPAMAVPGWFAVQTLRHTEGLAQLDEAEAAELGPLCVRLSTAITKITAMAPVYTYSLGEGCPHTHVLIGPPRRDLRGSAFLRAVLRRDEFLADEHEARHIAAEVAAELATIRMR
jgi:diadenosine tetraphosphate (Ap4A) HIT family hydrolase